MVIQAGIRMVYSSNNVQFKQSEFSIEDGLIHTQGRVPDGRNRHEMSIEGYASSQDLEARTRVCEVIC